VRENTKILVIASIRCTRPTCCHLGRSKLQSLRTALLGNPLYDRDPWTWLTCEKRWASTFANRSNAQHRSNIRAAPPPPPPPDVCIQSEGICVARRGRKRFIATCSWGQDVTYLSLHPMPSLQVERSKVKSRHFAHLCL
jgi:hypothetical protein